MADVVDLCKSGIKKTHIMYHGNLSYEQINRYLQELLKKRANVDISPVTGSVWC